MSKRRFSVVAHLNPKKKGRVLAAPIHASEKGERTVSKTLAEVTQTMRGVEPDDLCAVFKLESVKLPPIKVLSGTSDAPVEVKEIQAVLTLFELDFGQEDAHDVELLRSDGLLVKTGANRWRFEFSQFELGRTPYDGDHVPYIRIVSAAQPDRYVLVAIDPEKVGHLTKEEGDHYEVAFRLELYDPGYEAGPGEDSAKQVDRGTLLAAPEWWEDYKAGKKRKVSGQRELPTLRVVSGAEKHITDEQLRNALGNYVRKLESRVNQHWDRMGKVMDYFSQKADDDLSVPAAAPTSFWSVLKSAYTLASLALPALRGIGVLIEVVEAFKLADVVEEPEAVTKNTRQQAQEAFEKAKAGVDATITFIGDLEGFIKGVTADKPADGPRQLRVSDFVQQAIERGANIQAQQEGAAKAFEQTVLARMASTVKPITETQRREVYDELVASYLSLDSSDSPSFETMLSDLIVEFMNAYGLGVYTWSLDGVPANKSIRSHSDVAGPNVNLERHAYFLLRNAFGGKLQTDGHLHVTAVRRRSYLAGLKAFKEFEGEHAMKQHFREKQGAEADPDDIDADSTHHLHKDRIYDSRLEPRITWSWAHKNIFAYYELRQFK